MRDARQGLTDEQFAELARRRDENLSKAIDGFCAEMGWDRSLVGMHVGGNHTPTCYCACPDGPCQHDWTGPGQDILDDNDEPCGWERTCARCGMGSMSHDLKVLP